MLAHGVPIVFYKMDNNGIGDEIRYEDLPRNRGLRFDQFTPDLFLQMCLSLSLCDYFLSLYLSPNIRNEEGTSGDAKVSGVRRSFEVV